MSEPYPYAEEGKKTSGYKHYVDEDHNHQNQTSSAQECMTLKEALE
jgi:hypothetical protein